MRTDLRESSIAAGHGATDWGRPLKRAVVALIALLAGSAPQLHAQAPLFLVNDQTRVGSLEYVFAEGRSLTLDRVAQETALSDPGFLAGLQRKMAWLPFVGPPAPIPFDPVQLQKDVVRLRRFYGTMGFPRAVVSYDVVLDSVENAVDIKMAVNEGPPIILDAVTVDTPSGGPVADELPQELLASWTRLESDLLRSARGRRFGETQRVSLRSLPLRWARNRGYAFASVTDEISVDTVSLRASSAIRLDLGPRARVDSIQIVGNQALSRPTLTRELPMTSGDWYSEYEVNEGQRQLFGLDLIRLALADLPEQPRDSTATVRYRIEEGRLRLVSAEGGYSSVSGLRSRADWTHRDFSGRARVLTATIDARSGWLALEGNTDRTLGASVSLRQPYVFDRRISASLSPFVEYRDGLVDRSWSYGAGLQVHWEKGPLATVSLQYRLSRREVLEIRAGVEALGNVTLIDAIAALDSLESGVASSVLTLSTIHGELDDPLRPTRGWTLRTSTDVAGPSVISAVEYARGQIDASGFMPLGRDVGLAVRGGLGLMRPFGVSSPTPQSDTTALLIRLREAMLTAGGTQSVRGWGSGLLGPKLPNFRLVPQGDSVVLDADRYVPFNGLARITTSAELLFPMPFSESDNGTFVFVDGGKVWNPDERFGTGDDTLGQENFFWSTGAGLRFETLVGSVRLSLGYKLNPSPLDLRDSRLVGATLIAGGSIDSVPTSNLRRFHLHLSIGRGL